MRKFLIPALALAAALFLVQTVQAQAFKVGVVSMEEVFKKSDPGKQVLDNLKVKFESATKEMAAKEEELRKLKSELEKQRMMIKPEVLMDKQSEFEKKLRDFQYLTEERRRKFQMEKQQLFKPLEVMFKDVINDYGKKNGYTMILDAPSAETALFNNILYFNESVDITNKVIFELNAAWRKDKGKK